MAASSSAQSPPRVQERSSLLATTGYRIWRFCQSSNCPKSWSFSCCVIGCPPAACCRSSINREKIALRSCTLGAAATCTLRCSHCSAGGKRRQPGNSAAILTSCHFGWWPGSSTDRYGVDGLVRSHQTWVILPGQPRRQVNGGHCRFERDREEVQALITSDAAEERRWFSGNEGQGGDLTLAELFERHLLIVVGG